MSSKRFPFQINGPQNAHTPANHKKHHSRQNSRGDPSTDTQCRQQLARIHIGYIGRSNIPRLAEVRPDLLLARLRIFRQIPVHIAADPGHDPPPVPPPQGSHPATCR